MLLRVKRGKNELAYEDSPQNVVQIDFLKAMCMGKKFEFFCNSSS
jgi:hypothetical protein